MPNPERKKHIKGSIDEPPTVFSNPTSRVYFSAASMENSDPRVGPGLNGRWRISYARLFRFPAMSIDVLLDDRFFRSSFLAAGGGELFGFGWIAELF